MGVAGRLRRAAQALLGTERSQPVPQVTVTAALAAKVTKDVLRAERQAQKRRGAAAPNADGDAQMVLLDYPRHEVRLLAGSRMEREWRANSCAKEPWTVQWLEEVLQDGDVLYDIGANTGAFALIAATLVGGRGTVVAFEPGYASYARLCDNIVLNGCQEVVIPVPLALGRRTGLGTFIYNTLHPGQSRHDFNEKVWTRDAGASSGRYGQPMLSITLDAAIEHFRLPRPQHIKIDVDGTESNVLRGAAATLSDPALRSVLIEIDDRHTDEILRLMDERGFMLQSRHERDHQEMTQVWYGVFTRRPVEGRPPEP